MKKYKLVATDLDGTLLFRHVSVSNENKRALKLLHEEKVAVAITTGRNVALVSQELREIPGIKYIITSNGAAIYENNPVQLVYKNLISHDVLLDYVKKVSSLAYSIQVLYLDRMVSTKDEDTLHFFEIMNKEKNENPEYKNLGYFDQEVVFVDNMVEYLEKNIEDAAKIDIIFRDDALFLDNEKILEKQNILSRVICFKNSIEVTNIGVSKGEALKKICNMMNISITEALAFGDSGNDISMKEVGADFCAMGNSDDDMKRIADLVTDECDDSGFAHMIFRLNQRR